MTTVMRRRMPGMTGQAGSMARQLAGTGVLAGLLGGLAMIGVMILVMGAAGMGYATPTPRHARRVRPGWPGVTTAHARRALYGLRARGDRRRARSTWRGRHCYPADSSPEAGDVLRVY
jgi:hypothetical protein